MVAGHECWAVRRRDRGAPHELAVSRQDAVGAFAGFESVIR